MAKQNIGDEFQRKGNQNKPNRGLDEIEHTFVMPDGTEQVKTQRWFKDEGRAAGAVKKDDVTAPDVDGDISQEEPVQ